MLIELASLGDRHAILDQAGFYAKFVTKAFGIMQRIGSDGDGYENLSKQYSEQVERMKELIQTLLEGAPEEIVARFDRQFFALTPESFNNLMKLFYDLSWYKNWLIDNARK